MWAYACDEGAYHFAKTFQVSDGRGGGAIYEIKHFGCDRQTYLLFQTEAGFKLIDMQDLSLEGLIFHHELRVYGPSVFVLLNNAKIAIPHMHDKSQASLFGFKNLFSYLEEYKK